MSSDSNSQYSYSTFPEPNAKSKTIAPAKETPEPVSVRNRPEDEVIEDSEVEVDSIVLTKPASSNIKKRRNVAVDEVIDGPSAKRRRGKPAAANDPEPQSISAPSRSSRKRSERSLPRVPSVKSRPTRAATSSRRTVSAKERTTSNGQGLSSASQRPPSKEPSPDEMLLGADDVPDDISSEAEQAIVVESLDVEPTDASNVDLFGDEVDVEMQGVFTTAVDDSAITSSSVAARKHSESKIPAHRARAANPRVKMLEDTFTAHSGLEVKAALARRMDLSAGPSSTPKLPSTSRASVLASRASPGSSSATFLGSTSLLTAGKDGGLITIRKQMLSVATPPIQKERASFMTTDIFHAAESEYLPEVIETTSEEVPVPTAEEMLRLAGMEKSEAEAPPDYEASDRDAEGESDHEGTHGGHHHDEAAEGSPNVVTALGTLDEPHDLTGEAAAVSNGFDSPSARAASTTAGATVPSDSAVEQ